ncbi:MAG: SRPBCC family protein [Solimonas sp.]
MLQHEIRFHETIRAPLPTVFDFLADHENFATLFGGRCVRIRTGDDPAEPNGLGSIRRIGPGPLSFDERIVTFERPTRLEYTIVRGGPLKNHLGTITLKAAGSDTELDYVIRFDGKFPGAGTLAGRALSLAWRRSAGKAFARIEG